MVLKITGSQPFCDGESCSQVILNDESKFGGDLPYWFKLEFDEPILVKGYKIETANDCEERDPKSWELLDENGK
jgi:hypothetical protein